MSNEARDELAKLLFVTDNNDAKDPEREWELATRYGWIPEYVCELADAILADGYRKPRVITTVEELNELESGSVILCVGDRTGDGDGDQVLHRTTSFVKPWQNHFVAYFHSDAVFEDFETITVLREGET